MKPELPFFIIDNCSGNISIMIDIIKLPLCILQINSVNYYVRQKQGGITALIIYVLSLTHL